MSENEATFKVFLTRVDNGILLRARAEGEGLIGDYEQFLATNEPFGPIGYDVLLSAGSGGHTLASLLAMAWASDVKKMQDAARQATPEEAPDSPYVNVLEAEARSLAQAGNNGESLMLWVRIWEEKAAAWEAAGKPEYAAAERAQAERCRQRLADLSEPPNPPGPIAQDGGRFGELILGLKQDGRPLCFRDRGSLDELRSICEAHGIPGLSLKSLAFVWAWFFKATSRKTIQEIYDTPLVDVVAKLRETPAAAPGDRVTLADIVAIVGTPAIGTIRERMRAEKKAGRPVPASIGSGSGKRTFLYAELKVWLIKQFPASALDSQLPDNATAFFSQLSTRKGSAQ